MDLNKDLVGKVIFGVATGNGARGNRGKLVLTKFTVMGVRRKYFDLSRTTIDDGEISLREPDSYCPVTGALESQIRLGYGGNSGYKFYRTVQEAQDDFDKERMYVEIMNNAYALKKLSYNQIKDIYNAMGFNEGQDNA